MRENGDEVEGLTVCDEKHKQSRVTETPVVRLWDTSGISLLSAICLVFFPIVLCTNTVLYIYFFCFAAGGKISKKLGRKSEQVWRVCRLLCEN